MATKPFASDDPWVSWRHILLAAGLLALAIAGTLWFVHPLPRLGCSVLMAFLMLRMFVIYHDQQHYAILPDSRVAEVVMWVFGVWALSPSSVWRSSHNHHHAHNSRLRGSHIGSFPIMTAEAFRKASPSARRKYLFMRHPATIALGYFFIFIVGMCLKPFFSNPRRHWDALVAILLHVAIGLGLAWWGGWRAVVYTQTLPCLLLYAIGSYLFYVQHNFPGVQFRDQSEWTHEGAAMESSSFLRLGPVMTWFSANIGYHHIHHLNSRIPFYRLPETMSAIPELQTARGSSLHPLEVYRCLRLKVWDVAAQRMTRV